MTDHPAPAAMTTEKLPLCYTSTPSGKPYDCTWPHCECSPRGQAAEELLEFATDRVIALEAAAAQARAEGYAAGRTDGYADGAGDGHAEGTIFGEAKGFAAGMEEAAGIAEQHVGRGYRSPIVACSSVVAAIRARAAEGAKAEKESATP